MGQQDTVIDRVSVSEVKSDSYEIADDFAKLYWSAQNECL